MRDGSRARQSLQLLRQPCRRGAKSQPPAPRPSFVRLENSNDLAPLEQIHLPVCHPVSLHPPVAEQTPHHRDRTAFVGQTQTSTKPSENSTPSSRSVAHPPTARRSKLLSSAVASLLPHLTMYPISLPRCACTFARRLSLISAPPFQFPLRPSLSPVLLQARVLHSAVHRTSPSTHQHAISLAP